MQVGDPVLGKRKSQTHQVLNYIDYTSGEIVIFKVRIYILREEVSTEYSAIKFRINSLSHCVIK